MTLMQGKLYTISHLVLLGWTDGDGSGAEGYNLLDYFDYEGRYLGADQHGIEPIVEEL